MEFDITAIINGVIAIIGVVITTFLIPYLKTKMTTNQFAYLEGIVKTAVYAAEVFFTGDHRGAEKRDFVMEYVANFCASKHIVFDESEVRQMLERSWIDLVTELNKE